MDDKEQPPPPKRKTDILKVEIPRRQLGIEFWRAQRDEATFGLAAEPVELAGDVKHGRRPPRQKMLTCPRRPRKEPPPDEEAK